MTIRLERWASALVAVTFGLLVLGASVRVHGAGLACPDWPLCFGQVVPRIDFHVGLEFGHRVVAGVVSLLFLAVGGAVLAQRSRWGRLPVVLVALAAVALLVQIVLGGLTVLELLAEWTVASHLLTGNVFCALLLLLALSLRERGGVVARPAVRPIRRALALGMAVLVPTQLVLGGWVSSSFAGLACGTWPTCDGVTFIPTLAGPVGLQVAHRLVAYVLLALALAIAVAGRGRAELALLAAVTFQATVGVLNVLLRLPVEVTLLHTAGAAAVFLCTTWVNWEVWRAPLASPRFVGAFTAAEAR